MEDFKCYRNIRSHNWSLLGKSGKVEYRLGVVCLSGCKFVVREKARLKVVANRRKSVHAFVVGEICSPPRSRKGWVQITYNPYLYKTFVRVDNKEPVKFADKVLMTRYGKVFAHGLS